MSTRSYICLELPDNKMVGVYCHWDGYLEHNGRLLVDHYETRDKVEELLRYGDISSLDSTIEDCEFYNRDRGEKLYPARFLTEEILESSWAEYYYLFGLDDNWYVKTSYTATPWILLDAALSDPTLVEGDSVEKEEK